MKVTGGPSLSAGEREGKRKEGAGWAWPKKEKRGAGELGRTGRKEGRGCKELWPVSSLFLNKFSTHFPIEFVIKLTFCFHNNHHSKNVPACTHQKCYSNLY
jgi:hypothetical protein